MPCKTVESPKKQIKKDLHEVILTLVILAVSR